MGRGEWLIYALGGGWGHLTRAAALARRAPGGVRILSNSPYAEIVRAGLPGLNIDAIDPGWDAARVREYTSGLINASNAEWLIVDTFPRGLGGELVELLPGLRMKKALIHRDLNPEYVRQVNLCEFVRVNYDVVFAVDEAPSAIAELPNAVHTPPWLNRSADELKAPRDGGGSILVLASGNRDELAWYESIAASIPALFPGIVPRLVKDEWPAMDLLPSAGVVVGGAGYNTVYECAACQVPLVARAWPRLYDRQRLRAELVSRRTRVALVESVVEACAAVAKFLGQRIAPARSFAFVNGVDHAAGILGADQNGAIRTSFEPCATL